MRCSLAKAARATTRSPRGTPAAPEPCRSPATEPRRGRVQPHPKQETAMKRTARLYFPAMVALALALPATAQQTDQAKPANAPGPERQQSASQALTEVQVRALLASADYTRISDVEYDDGMWEADATTADCTRVDLRVDSEGRILVDDQVSSL